MFIYNFKKESWSDCIGVRCVNSKHTLDWRGLSRSSTRESNQIALWNLQRFCSDDTCRDCTWITHLSDDRQRSFSTSHDVLIITFTRYYRSVALMKAQPLWGDGQLSWDIIPRGKATLFRLRSCNIHNSKILGWVRIRRRGKLMEAVDHCTV